MKDELNHSYIGGGVVYLLQSELSTSTRQYVKLRTQVRFPFSACWKSSIVSIAHYFC